MSPRHIVRDRAAENYYVSSEGTGIARLTSSGEPEAFFADAVITTAMALTRNDRDLLIVIDNGRRFVVLTTPDLNPRLSIELPAAFEGQVVVPLRVDNRAIIVGGSPASGETAVGSPLKVLSVNLATGALGQIQPLSNPNDGRFELGDGNEWTDTGEATAIVPTGVGTVTIDTNRGTATFHSAPDLQRELPPCCDIASYPSRDRAVFSNADFSADLGGSLIVYEIDEQILRVQWEASAGVRNRALQLRLAKAQERLKGLTDAFLDGLIEKDLFRERQEALLMERRELGDQIGREPQNGVYLPDRLREFLELAGNLYSSYENGIDEEKRELLEIATSNRMVQRKHVRIVLKEPFRLIAERAPLSNGAPCRTTHRILDEVLAALGKYFTEHELVMPKERP